MQRFTAWAYFIKSTHFFAFCIILYLVERLRVGERSSGMRMASWVMPMMRRTSLSSGPISLHHLQPIPALFEGHDRDTGVGFEHLADVGYLDVEGEGVGITVVSPDMFQ